MVSGRRYRTGLPKGRLDFTAESVTHRLLETIAPKLESQEGGYTRLIRLARTRVGDSAPLATIQLVGDETAPMSLTKPKRSARSRRADARYALAIKISKSWRDRTAKSDVDVQAESDTREAGSPPESSAEGDPAGS
jgi:large subunit ribosomal protein L17